ncbi:Fc.00g057290.m01.CDS01 [Cosmosporella sp. VM-42]
MAPGTRRANRSGYAEHDDFEGLPVRQWRHDWVNLAPPSQQEQPQQNDVWAMELLYGMPKDSHLIPPHSQELLLAARSGRLYKRPAPIEEEEADPEAILPEKPEKKEEDSIAKGFSVKVWKQLPRNVEAQTVSHLAKRRKNTITIASKTVEDSVKGPTVTRATVRKIDAAGNPYTEEVTLGEGQQVQGQIIATRIEAVATGFVADPVAPTPPPQRRRPPPPKRKSKAGPGRGKKKVKLPLPGTETPADPAAPSNGAAPAASVKPEQTDNTVIKQEGEDNNNNQDSEMADGDDDHDDDESDDGEEGEEGDEGDETQTPGESSQQNGTSSEDPKTQDHEMTDATFAVNPPPEKPDTNMTDPEMSSSQLVPLNLLSLAPPAMSLAAGSPKFEGSPLKNVLIPSPTTEVPPEIPLAPAASTVPEVIELPQAPAAPNSTIPEAASTVAEVSSTIAEPPSAIVGEAPETAVERDVPKLEPSQEAALLPPPPDQVGNIATTPSAEEPSTNLPDSGDKPAEEIQPGEEALPEPERPSLFHNDTADTIQPDDSASASFPISVPEAPSVPDPVPNPGPASPPAPSSAAGPAPASAEEKNEEVPVTEFKLEELEETKPPSPPVEEAPAPIDEPDLLNGLMGELDRQSADYNKENSVSMSAPAPELAPELVQELAPDPAPKPAVEPAVDPTPVVEQRQEPAVEAVAEPEKIDTAVVPAEDLPAPVEQPVEQPVAQPVDEKQEDKPADA